MFGIDAEKLFVLLIIGALVLGPDKLPEYAAKLGRLVREARRLAAGAQEQLREELGPDFEDVNWNKLDPRQYDLRCVKDVRQSGSFFSVRQQRVAVGFWL